MRTVAMQDTEDIRPPLTEIQIAELAAELRGDLRHLMPKSDWVPGIVSADLEWRGQERRPLILAALARVDAGTYGTCLGCREPIPYPRLAAIPETQTCIDCVRRRDDSGATLAPASRAA